MGSTVRRLAVAVVLIATAGSHARGDDPERVRLDLTAFAAPPAATHVRIRVPADAGYSWTNLPGADDEEEGSLVALAPAPFPDTALSPELVDDLLRRLVSEATAPETTFKVAGRTVDVAGPASGVAVARRAVAWLEGAWAPRLGVEAALLGPTGAAAASGAGGLLPRRWTRLWWRRELHRHVVGYAVEVAQSSVMNRPIVAAIAEGGELYLRWSPGEETSLVEVYVAEASPLPGTKVDLTAVRNAPEVSPMATVELPVTAIGRLYTTLVVPAKGATLELGWEGGAGARRVVLAFGPPPAPPAAIPTGPGSLRVARATAAAAALDLGARDSGVADLVARFQATSPVDGGIRGLETTAEGFLTGEGAPAELDRLAAEIRRVEATLVPIGLDVRLLRLPADAAGAEWRAGRRVPAEALGAAGRTVVAAARLPVLSGAPASLRLSTSVTGFGYLSGAVAQEASGVQPETGAWFDGLAGSLRATRRDDGRVDVLALGTLSWVRPGATRAELAFRTPLGLEGRTGAGGVDVPDVRRTTVPLVATGDAKVEAAGSFAPGEAGALVLATTELRDPEGRPATLVLVVSVVR